MTKQLRAILLGVTDLKIEPIDFKRAKRLSNRFLRSESGATTIEYGLIAAIIGIVVLVGVGAIGGTLRDDVFGAVVTALQGALAG